MKVLDHCREFLILRDQTIDLWCIQTLISLSLSVVQRFRLFIIARRHWYSRQEILLLQDWRLLVIVRGAVWRLWGGFGSNFEWFLCTGCLCIHVVLSDLLLLILCLLDCRQWFLLCVVIVHCTVFSRFHNNSLRRNFASIRPGLLRIYAWISLALRGGVNCVAWFSILRLTCGWWPCHQSLR